MNNQPFFLSEGRVIISVKKNKPKKLKKVVVVRLTNGIKIKNTAARSVFWNSGRKSKVGGTKKLYVTKRRAT
ncbi:MAG: hypothetical protein AMXMBFR48_00640 [Ignavibacteriales bacterium]